MIVLISGMPRSASTWSYNVCRSLLENAGRAIDPESGIHDAAAIDDFVGERAATADTALILKWHFPARKTLDAIARGDVNNVFTVRDPRSAIASLMRTFGTSFKNASRETQRALNLLAWYRNTETVIVPFSAQQSDPQGAVAAIGRGLGMEVGPDVAATIASSFGRDRMLEQVERNKGNREWRTFEKHRHDPRSLLTEHHIRSERPSDWRNDLTPSQARYLTWRWRDMLPLCGVADDSGGAPAPPSLVERAKWGVQLKLWKVPTIGPDLRPDGGEA